MKLSSFNLLPKYKSNKAIHRQFLRFFLAEGWLCWYTLPSITSRFIQYWKKTDLSYLAIWTFNLNVPPLADIFSYFFSCNICRYTYFAGKYEIHVLFVDTKLLLLFCCSRYYYLSHGQDFHVFNDDMRPMAFKRTARNVLYPELWYSTLLN